MKNKESAIEIKRDPFTGYTLVKILDARVYPLVVHDAKAGTYRLIRTSNGKLALNK